MKQISRDTLKHQINFSFPEQVRRNAAYAQSARRFLGVFALWFGRYKERMRMRRELATITRDELRDLDLTFAQAERLANTPFWRQ